MTQFHSSSLDLLHFISEYQITASLSRIPVFAALANV